MKPKEPTAPSLYPDLPVENGQNYRLQKISEVEKQLILERDTRKNLYKKYKRLMNAFDGIDTTLFTAGMAMGGAGVAVPVLLVPLEIAASVCGVLGVCVMFFKRKLITKAQKHHEIKTYAETKLNSIHNLISEALKDSQISDQEFKLVLDELEKYNALKNDLHSKHVKEATISDEQKKKLIEEGKSQAMADFQKKILSLNNNK